MALLNASMEAPNWRAKDLAHAPVVIEADGGDEARRAIAWHARLELEGLSTPALRERLTVRHRFEPRQKAAPPRDHYWKPAGPHRLELELFLVVVAIFWRLREC